MNAPSEPALTLRQCADELGLKSTAVLKTAIKAGRLRALILSGVADPTSRGPKLYRIERPEWDRFKASIRTAAPMADSPLSSPPRKGRPKKGETRSGGRMSGYY